MALAETAPQHLGQQTEFCVGGPTTNSRSRVHLRAFLPGVHIAADVDAGTAEFRVGGSEYVREPGRLEYALVARVTGRAAGRPVFLVVGQTSQANLAAARMLAREHRRLARQYGNDRDFCLVLRILEPDSYGSDLAEVVSDVTAAALRFDPPPPRQPSLGPPTDPDVLPTPQQNTDPAGEQPASG
ncbi:hypothetical protein ACNAW0_29730 [Micromonospora sp. SL1-18]|uniref:hypothetical protein n=1 Tax=Micromonospora sp. SL1-18 TaxID=3399128 RepID=UPI003A4DB198